MQVSVGLLVFMLAGQLHTSSAILDWLFGAKGSDNESQGEVKTVRTSALKFEVPTTDDKFLQLKDALDDLSPLDSCYHIVVYKLKKRCGELSEEELGKLSVRLLNCQSAAEERATYTCTDDMTLAECTKGMDPTTWNSYHIVSNRARALCYATQQVQFRRLTEVTVNQLVSTAHGQLEYLKQIQNGQEQLHLMTTDTVRKLYESQKDLIGNQQDMRTTQDDTLKQIHDNMAQLRHEKAMIATGNKELADLTENIHTKLDQTADQLRRQERANLRSHEKILADLTRIQRKTHDALDKLDASSQYIMRNHDEMIGHYGNMYSNMLKINSTVTSLLTMVTYMQGNLDDRIKWFSRLLSMADDKLSLLTCGAVHLGYFLFAALAASFLQTPAFSRVVLFLIVALNVTMEIQCNNSLDLVSLSLFMFLVCAVNWFYLWWRRKSSPQAFGSDVSGTVPMIGTQLSTEELQDIDDRNQCPDTTTDSPGVTSPLTANELRQLTMTLGRLYTSLNESIQTPGADNSMLNRTSRSNEPSFAEPRPSTSAFTPVHRTEQVRPDSSTVDDIAKVRRYLATLDEDQSSLGEPSPTGRPDHVRFRQGSTSHRPSSRGSMSTNRSLCQGFTKAGTPCRLSAIAGLSFCHRHRNQHPADT